MKWNEKVYALYSKGVNICDGTIPEIAEKTGKTIEHLRWLKSDTAKRRAEKRGCPDAVTLELIVEMDTLLSTLLLSDESLDALDAVDILTAQDLVDCPVQLIRELNISMRTKKEILRYRDFFKEYVEKEALEIKKGAVPMRFYIYNGQKCLTTEQIAILLGVNKNTISRNYQRNKERYTSEHHILLTGSLLKSFKKDVGADDSNLKFYSTLSLWTEKGIKLLFKSSRSDKSWELIARELSDIFD